MTTSGALPARAVEDIRLHTDEFFEGSWWAQELLKTIEQPGYQSTQADQGDMTMMMMVVSQMESFKEQWYNTDLSTKEIIFAVGQLIANNKQTREQAERALGAMLDRTREAHAGGTVPSLE